MFNLQQSFINSNKIKYNYFTQDARLEHIHLIIQIMQVIPTQPRRKQSRSSDKNHLSNHNILSFSPDQSLSSKNKDKTFINNLYHKQSNPNNIYSIYQNKAINVYAHKPDPHKNKIDIHRNKKIINNFNENPENNVISTKQKQHANLFSYPLKDKNRSFSSQLSRKDKLISISGFDSKPTNEKVHITKKKSMHNTISDLHQNLNSTLSNHATYTSQKHTMHETSQTRLQNQKDLTYLSRTLYNTRKSEQRTKQQLLKRLLKKAQNQERQRQKQDHMRKRESWLQNQKNQNHTNKYMNHLMKYHAKKYLQEQHQQIATYTRQRSKSASSIKSMSSINSHKSNYQKVITIKNQIKQNIERSRLNNTSRIQSRSNSVRNQMVRIYEVQTHLDAWKIQKLDSQQRIISKAIQNSKKNKERLSSLIHQSPQLNKTEFVNLITNLN